MENAEVQIETDQKVVKHYIIKLAECSICSEICSNQEKLVQHMSLVHQIKPADRPLQCPTCHLSFKHRSNLWRHKQTHLQRPPFFQCQQCPKSFQNKGGLSLHMRTHTDEKPYTCQLCSFKSKQTSNLKTHMLKHEAAQCKCNECDRVFKHKGTLLKHINSEHLGKKEMFPCPLCNKNFSSRQAMKAHVKVHTGEDIAEECPICHKVYHRLREHMVRHQEKSFACKICPKSFTTAPYLRIHMRIHTGEKPFECKFCSHQFRQHAHYMAHIRTHTSEKGYECNVCKQSFSSPDYLKIHRKKHDGILELKHNCTVCSKKFLSSYHLRVHAAIHLAPAQREKFECKECGLKLATKHSLKAHMKKHTGVRIKCAFCDRDFYREDMYDSHLRTHTDEKEFVCKTCGEECNKTRHYKVHFNKCSAKVSGK